MKSRATPPPRSDNDPPGQKRGDLRIPNTTPEQLAKKLLCGGVSPRSETKKRPTS